MTFARTDRIAALTIVAGGAIGGLLTFSPLVLWSPADDVAEQVTAEARAEESLEFKLVLPVTELESALFPFDRQIVGALGVDSTLARVVQPGRLKAEVRIPQTQAQDISVVRFER